MAFFNDLTTSLKQKWLQFFQVNRSWIARHMDIQSVSTPDGGRRPPSYLILGVANALEPQLAELMLPFTKLNPDVDALIDAVELNFDPDLMLGNRFHPANLEEPTRDESSSDAALTSMLQAPTYNITVVETLTEVEPDQMIGMSLDDVADDQLVLVTSDDESIMVLNVPDQDQLIGMSLDDQDDSIIMLNIPDQDQANGMSLDATANDEAMAETDDESIVLINVDELDELSNMLLDDTDSELMESDDGLPEPSSAAQPDMFGNMSLDEMADLTVPLESDENLKTPSAAQADESDDVLLDMWGEEKLADSDEADEKQSEHNQEISRLFPNL